MSKVSVLFGEEGTVRESVDVEIRSETDFRCTPRDPRVTAEMVQEIFSCLTRGMVCGRIDAVEWQQ
jgi:hypothetical protein